MESIITYLIIGLVAIVSLITYRWKRVKVRQYLLSQQPYPALILELHIEKHLGKVSATLLKIIALEDLTIDHVMLELINKDRQFNYYDLMEHGLVDRTEIKIKRGEFFIYRIEYKLLTTLLETGEHPFRTFRFVLSDKIDKKYKTHELGINKKWQLLRPDSGNYN